MTATLQPTVKTKDERDGEKSGEAEMEIGLYDNDAITACVFAHTHSWCRVTAEVPVCLSKASVRDRNVTRPESV